MKIIVIGSIALLASLTLAFAGAPEGKTVFASKCQPCHGPNGEGKPAIAKMYSVTMRPFASKEVQARTDADFKKIVTTGQGKMKPLTGLSDKDVTDVIAFVRTLKQ
jgi:mono/diheme cytochrome c family protein